MRGLNERGGAGILVTRAKDGEIQSGGYLYLSLRSATDAPKLAVLQCHMLVCPKACLGRYLVLTT